MQVPCLVIANVCNMLTMPVVATKCLVYLLNTVRKCHACRWMGWNCALKGAPTAVFGRAAFLCQFKFSVCFHIAYIYIDTKRKKKISLLSSLTLIQPLQILLCCATVALCVMLCTENTQKPSMTCTGNASYKSDVRLLLCLTTLYLLVLKLHLKLIKVSFLSLCGCFIEVF